MTTDLCPTTSPHPAHRRDLGPFGVKDCPGVTDTRAMPNGTERPGEHWNARLIREEAERAAAAAPRDAALSPDQIGDAPATIGHYRATIANLSDDTVREALAAMYVVRDRQAEQLRRNGTLLCRVQDAIADIDRAWADHDTLGRGEPADADLTGDDVDAPARAMETADRVRIDRDDSVWRPAPNGRWTHRGLGLFTLDELEAQYGPTRTVLLVDIAPDDTDMGDPPADWRLDLGGDQDDTDPTDAERAATTAHIAIEAAEQMADLEQELAGERAGARILNAEILRLLGELERVTADRDRLDRELTAARTELDINDTAWRTERDGLRDQLADLRSRLSALAALEEYIGESCGNASHNLRDVLAGNDPRPDADRHGLDYARPDADQANTEG